MTNWAFPDINYIIMFWNRLMEFILVNFALYNIKITTFKKYLTLSQYLEFQIGYYGKTEHFK